MLNKYYFHDFELVKHNICYFAVAKEGREEKTLTEAEGKLYCSLNLDTAGT